MLETKIGAHIQYYDVREKSSMLPMRRVLGHQKRLLLVCKKIYLKKFKDFCFNACLIKIDFFWHLTDWLKRIKNIKQKDHYCEKYILNNLSYDGPVDLCFVVCLRRRMHIFSHRNNHRSKWFNPRNGSRGYHAEH